MPHYLRFVRVLALGSTLACGACGGDDDDAAVRADAATDAPVADADLDADVIDGDVFDAPVLAGEGPLPPPDLAA